MANGSRWAVIGAVAVGIAAGAAACSSSTSKDAPTTASAGAEIYASNCATCHATDGSGGQGPAIGDGQAEAKYTEAEMIDLVTDGRDAMPAWKGTLTDVEIAQVV